MPTGYSGDKQRVLLAMRQGESDLVYREGNWYLLATVNYEEPPPGEPDVFLGIDLGIVLPVWLEG